MSSTATTYKPKRATVALEDAEIIDQQAFAGQQFILRVRAPKAARRAAPGMFAHTRLRSRRAAAPAAVDHAREPDGGLARVLVQTEGPRARQAFRAPRPAKC